MMYLVKKYKEIFTVKADFMYQDIYTMPIYNWFKVMSENNLGFLNIESTSMAPENVENKPTQEYVDRWFKLADQHANEFGRDESTTDMLEKKRDLLILHAEYLSTGNKFKLTQIEIKELDLERFETGGKFDSNKEVGILSKHLGSMIDIRKTTVHQYYSLKELVKNG